MKKIKKIIISLAISVFLVTLLMIAITSKSNSQYIEYFVYNQDLIAGDKLTLENVKPIKIKKDIKIGEVIEGVESFEQIKGKVLTRTVKKGQLINKEDFTDSNNIVEEITGYKNISIPVTSSSNIICKKLNQGDKITVYFTAKAESVSKVINNKQKLYSNGQPSGMVTCIVVNDAQFISAYDATGNSNTENVITDILIRVKQEDAMLAINLKSIGAFDVVKE